MTDRRRSEQAAVRRQILCGYARTGPNGDLSRCSDPRVGRRAKVIFNTRGATQLAAEALAEQAGSPHRDVYRCPSGDHWHHYTKRRIEES
jgi:hypothetical protein